MKIIPLPDKQNSFVVVDEYADKKGTFTLIASDNPIYSNIEGGKWLSDFSYISIFDIDVFEKKYKSKIAEFILNSVANSCKKKRVRSIRTHIKKQDLEMKEILKSNGYKHCGFYSDENQDYIFYEKLVIPFELEDTIMLKKSHPCGGNTFIVKRLGMDFKLECTTCHCYIWLKRSDLIKKIKKRLN